MALRLPVVVADVGPGGAIPTAFANIVGTANALSKGALDNRSKQLENQTYMDRTNADVGYKNALTESTNLNTQLLPSTTAADIAYKNSLASQTPFENALKQKEIKWYDQKAASDIATAKSIADWRKQGGGKGYGGADLADLNNISNSVKFEHPDWDDKKVYDATSAYINGDSTMPDGTPLPPASGQIQSVVDSLGRRGTSTGAQDQRRFALTTDRLLDSGKKYVQSASQYAGAQGLFNLKKDQIAASLGNVSPQYSDYLFFSHELVPEIAGEITRTLGAHQTDIQTGIMRAAVDPVMWQSNPTLALKNYERLQDLFKEVVGPVLASSPSQIKKMLKENSSSSTAPANTIRTKVIDGKTYHEVSPGQWVTD